MRLLFTPWAGALALLVVGCSGSGGPAAPPVNQGPSPDSLPGSSPIPSATFNGPVGLGGVASSGSVSEQAMAIYTVSVDPLTLTGSMVPREVRQGQANDDVTDLDVSCFLSGGSVSLVSVAKNAGNIDITYSFAHPFANTAPHTLGAPVRAVVMVDADVTAPTYFPGDGDVVANTSAVVNADGYLDPGELLDTTGFNATVFPYQALVDETLDNRDITNGSDVLGNWDDVAGQGWQTGLPGTWTGLGWVHKGQTVTRTLTLDGAALAASAVSFDLAFIAKYSKPNASGLNKSPSSPADTLEFAYRGFHGALDLESIQFVGESGGFGVLAPSASILDFRVRDWDAQAVESAQTDLALEPDASMVAIGESGEPTLELSIPDVLGATTYLMTEAADSGTGIAGDELVYSESVVKGGGDGPVAGTFTGLIRATDPEATLDMSTWRFAVDCAALPPIGGLITGPGLAIYQAFDVVLIPSNDPPVATVALTSADPMNSGTQPSLSISALVDTDNDPIDVYIDWGDGAGFPVIPDLAIPTGPYTPPYNFTRLTLPTMNNADLTPDLINVVVRVADGTVQVDYPLSYTLGPNRAPEIGAGVMNMIPNATFGGSLNITGTSVAATDPEGDAIDYIATSSLAPLGPFPNATGGPFPVSVGPYAAAGSPNITLYASDALHDNLTMALPDSATPYPVVAAQVTEGWLWNPVTSVPVQSEFCESLIVDQSGNTYIGGNFRTGANFGGGARTAITTWDNYLVKLNPQGQYVWDRVFGATSSDFIRGIDVDSTGNVYCNGGWAGVSNFSNFGGVDQTSNATTSALNRDVVVLKFDPAGVFGGMYRTNDGVSVGNYGNSKRTLTIDRNTNSVYIAGAYLSTGTSDFGVLPSVVPNAGSIDPFLVKLNTSLVPQWWTNLGTNPPSAGTGSTGSDLPGAVTTNAAGDVFVTGVYGGAFNFGAGAVPTLGGFDCFTTKRSAATGAATTFTRTFGGTISDEAMTCVADNTNVYIGGILGGVVANFGAPIPATTNVSRENYIAAYNHVSNTPLWARVMASPAIGTEHVYDLVLDGTNLYACGPFLTSIDFGAGAQAGLSGAMDFYLVKYTTANALVWSQTWTSAGGGQAYTMDADAGGDIHMCGSIALATLDFNKGPGTWSYTTAADGYWDAYTVKVDSATGQF